MLANTLQAQIAILEKARWFKDLSHPVLAEFAQAGRVRQFADGELIVARGAAPTWLAVVTKGAIRSATLAANGREVVFSLVPPGGVWGLVSTLDGLGAQYDTRAHRKTEALTIPHAAFIRVLDDHLDLYRHFSRILCARLRQTYNAIDEFALVPLRQRLIRQLYMLATSNNAERSGTAGVCLNLTQAEIAVMLGAARASVNRELSRLEDDGLVQLGYRVVTIPQLGKLRHFLEPDADYP